MARGARPSTLRRFSNFRGEAAPKAIFEGKEVVHGAAGPGGLPRRELKEGRFSLAATSQIPVGKCFYEPVSPLGRWLVEEEMCIVLDKKKATANLRRLGEKRLVRLKREAEWLIDELTWDADTLSGPEKVEIILQSVSNLKKLLSLVERRLRQWEKLGSREKATRLR